MKHEPGMAYNINGLHRIFAVLSTILLFAVLWMLLDDFIRPWKMVQMKGMKVEGEILTQRIEAEKKKISKAKLKELTENLKQAKKQVLLNDNQIKKVEADLLKLKGERQSEKIINSKYNSRFTELTYRYEMNNKHHPGDKKNRDLKEELEKYRLLFTESNNRKKEHLSSLVKLRKKLSELKKDESQAKKELESLTGTHNRLLLSLKKTDPNTLLWAVRNAPFFDYMDPTLRISQIVLNDITEDRYFRQVPRVDRCTTCHSFIDKAGYENQKNPFKTHPRLSLILGSHSPHPIKKIGCTICHGGEGHRMRDFNAAAHTPSTVEQKNEWIKKYHWHEPHHVARPMYKLKHTEAGCLKCHQGIDYIPQTALLNRGRKLIKTYGCYGCHKIKGWEHLRKSGPSLAKVGSKVTKEFLLNWIWNPKSFNPKAKMPSSFGQVNNSSDPFRKRNITEVNAISEYILSKSEKYVPFAQYKEGNPALGKTLISEIGCLGCHEVEGITEKPYDQVKNRTGSYLSSLGSKLDPNWLVSRLLRPTHYQTDSIMPSFRLSSSEANNIAAYLLSFKNTKFETQQFGPLDKAIRDELLLEYFSTFDTKKNAAAKLAALTERERTQELGHRSVGKYGCFSCHELKGFEKMSPIGPELSNVGSKPINQIGFGHQKIEQKRDVWLSNHLKNPRIWDQGVTKSFKDLLRMPNYNLPDGEVEAITVALLAQVSDKIPLAGIKRLSAKEQRIEKGNKVMNKFNCQGCHRIDGDRGDILKMYANNLHNAPPGLANEGAKVRSAWLHHFLQNVHKIRPRLVIRMPTFNMTNEEINAITEGFQARSSVVTFEDNSKKIVWAEGERDAAKKLFNALACKSCHSIGFSEMDPMSSDLHYAYKRLRPRWILNWLKNPKAELGFTMMPSFWFNGKSMEDEILDGIPELQRGALLKYIQELSYEKI
jgi:cytochrome c2